MKQKLTYRANHHLFWQLVVGILLLVLPVLSRASVLIYDIEGPNNKASYNGSTYGQLVNTTLMAQVGIRDWSYQWDWSRLPVTVSRQDIGGGRCRYRVTVWNAPAFRTYYSVVGQGINGSSQYTGRVFATDPNGTYYMGTVRFY